MERSVSSTSNGPLGTVTPIRPGPCGAKWPQAANIFCNLKVGHSGPHARIEWDPEDPSDAEEVATW